MATYLSSKDAKWVKKLTEDEIENLVRIGFGQPKFYRPEVWRKAKRVMIIACSLGLAEPFDFGRWKGKYLTDLSYSDVVSGILKARTRL
jgi:hypothetical protein